jgi:hypothetical protein
MSAAMIMAASAICRARQLGVAAQGAGRGQGVAAAGADGDHAVVRLDDVAGAGQQVDLVLVGDQQHGLEPAQHPVGAPVLGQLDRRRRRLPPCSRSLPSSLSNRAMPSAAEPAKPPTMLPSAMRRTLRAVDFMTVSPRETWPSPAMTVFPPRGRPGSWWSGRACQSSLGDGLPSPSPVAPAA